LIALETVFARDVIHQVLKQSALVAYFVELLLSSRLNLYL
jgi:hypothetical protein